MTTATKKAVNYTDAQTAKMVADYVSGATVEVIAAELGKTVRSVVAKLSREKVYVAKVRTTKTGDVVVKKDATADAIAALLGLTEAEAESLTKANKTALLKVLNALQMAVHAVDGMVTETDLDAADAVDAETFAAE